MSSVAQTSALRGSDVRRRFDQAAAAFDDYDFVHTVTRDGLLARLEPMIIDARTVVDLGCATGSACKPLAKRFRRARIIALDLSAGMLTHYSHWRPISQATIAYGYGISVTPLQLAHAYAAIGNDGVTQPVSLFALEEPGSGERIMSSETAVAVRRMLEDVVRPGGTGAKASVSGYRVAGKTGTAWKFAKGGYSQDK